MNVNPGVQFLSGNLVPEESYPIDVPASGGIIIQGANGYSYVMPDGGVINMNPDGSID